MMAQPSHTEVFEVVATEELHNQTRGALMVTLQTTSKGSVVATRTLFFEDVEAFQRFRVGGKVLVGYTPIVAERAATATAEPLSLTLLMQRALPAETRRNFIADIQALQEKYAPESIEQ